MDPVWSMRGKLFRSGSWVLPFIMLWGCSEENATAPTNELIHVEVGEIGQTVGHVVEHSMFGGEHRPKGMAWCVTCHAGLSSAMQGQDCLACHFAGGTWRTLRGGG